MGTQHGPDLSIIIPTYNRVSFLKEAVESFHGKLSCTYEVIIVDDGSSDGTAEYLKSLKEPFRVFLMTHQGPQAARNVGMQAATGQFLKFLDDDDLLTPSAVDDQVRYMQNCPDIGVGYSDWGLATYLNHQIQKQWLYVMNEIPDPVEYFIMDWWCPPFVYLFRRSVIENIRWDEIQVLTDFIFVADVILAGAKFGYMPTAPSPLGWYRAIVEKRLRVSESASNVERAHCELKILGKMETHLTSSGLLTEARKYALATRYYRIAKRVFPDDRRLFRQLVTRAIELVPQFQPEGNRYRQLIRWFGPENAEKLRRFSLEVRAMSRRMKHNANDLSANAVVNESPHEIIRIQVDRQTIIPKF